MPIVKAQCTNCGGNLEVDSAKDAAICPYCNTAYIVEKAINKYQINNHTVNNIANATIHTGVLDADTMFENWLVTWDDRLKKDFSYYYATDSRNEMMKAYLKNDYLTNHSQVDLFEKLARKYLVGPRFGKYLDPTLLVCANQRKRVDEFLEWCKAQDERRRLEKEQSEKRAKEAEIEVAREKERRRKVEEWNEAQRAKDGLSLKILYIVIVIILFIFAAWIVF